jgi:hypothetical protein
MIIEELVREAEQTTLDRSSARQYTAYLDSLLPRPPSHERHCTTQSKIRRKAHTSSRIKITV